MKERMPSLRGVSAALLVLVLATVPQAAIAKKTRVAAESKLPNILAIWGDDIGWFNLSIHNHGIMGYETENLDRIAKEGAMFTDAYAEQSCTAGRAAFLTGQHGMRSGMIKVGLPGVDFGLSHEDPTIAEILKDYGYTTGQFGKNHLGDADATLPTTHGFDEFFGNLYHLNAQEEPTHPDWGGNMPESLYPRGVIHSWAMPTTATDCTTAADTSATFVDGASYSDGVVRHQCVKDTGDLFQHRMKTIDGAFAKEAIRFMGEANAASTGPSNQQPFFAWYAASRMHIWTHLKEEGYDITAGADPLPTIDYSCHEVPLSPSAVGSDTSPTCNLLIGDLSQQSGAANELVIEGITGYGTHQDGMVEHDKHVGQLLHFLDIAKDYENKFLAENTIVMYTSDNGPETFSWPDGGTTPFRSEKATNWEGAYRVPLLVRWPGVLEGGIVSNEIIALQDWFPTLISAVSKASSETGTGINIKTVLKTGSGYPSTTYGRNYKVHLDGYDFYDFFRCIGGIDVVTDLTCDADNDAAPPRDEFIYANDDGVIVGIRYGDWKVVFHEQREHSFQVWQEPFTALRFPKLFNLRSDPFEKADHESSYYDDYRAERMFALTPAQMAVSEFLQTFENFPPRQAPPSFSVDVDVQDIIDACGTAPDLPGAPTGCDTGFLGRSDAARLPTLGFGG